MSVGAHVRFSPSRMQKDGKLTNFTSSWPHTSTPKADSRAVKSGIVAERVYPSLRLMV